MRHSLDDNEQGGPLSYEAAMCVLWAIRGTLIKALRAGYRGRQEG
jgi:hypothetical protein